MARHWTFGYDFGTTGLHITVTASGSPTVQAVTVRSGAHAGQVTTLVSGTRQGWYVDPISVATFTTRFLRVYLRVATRPSAENRILVATSGASISAVTQFAYLTLDSGGLLRLYDEDGQIGSASSALALNTWYRVELKVDLSAGSGAATHAIEAQIDGVAFAGATNRAISVGLRGFAWGGNLAAEAQTTGTWYFDDLALNDAGGSFQTSYPGAGSVAVLRPNGAGSATGWTIGGSAPAATNWQSVSELVPDDGTTMVVSPATANTYDWYAMDDTPAAIGATDSINVVQVIARFAGAAATDVNDAFTTVIKKGAGGTESASASKDPNSQTWVWRRSTPQANQSAEHTLYPDPDGAAWTKASLDTIQVGLKSGATPDTNRTNVTAVAVLVDSAPAGAASSGIIRRLLLGVG